MKFNIGDRVKNKDYGIGTIVEMGSGPFGNSILVQFDKRNASLHNGLCCKGSYPDETCYHFLEKTAGIRLEKVETMYLDREGKESGICGEKADFKDSLGNDLFVGDIVTIINTRRGYKIVGQNVIVKDAGNKTFQVMGLYGSRDFGQGSEWGIYRSVPYAEIPENFKILGHTYKVKKEEIEELTVAEIEEKLGHKVKIIKEGN